MLLKTFYQSVIGGGTLKASTTCPCKTMNNTSATITRRNNPETSHPMGAMLYSSNLSASGQYTDTGNNYNSHLVFGYDADRTALDTDMYTVRGTRVVPPSSSSSNCRTYALFKDNDTSKARTGVKLAFDFTNTTSSNKIINQVGIARTTSTCTYYQVPTQSNSSLVLLAVKYLDEDVTIAPQETYTFEYELKDLCPINEDLY